MTILYYYTLHIFLVDNKSKGKRKLIFVMCYRNELHCNPYLLKGHQSYKYD